jgi:nucleoside phosphorylase
MTSVPFSPAAPPAAAAAPAPAIGVVAGMRAEARSLRGPSMASAAVACVGGSAARARTAVAGMVAAGARGIVSFGLAGGLDPILRPGDLVLGDAVVLPEAGLIAADSDWCHRWLARAHADAAASVAALRTAFPAPGLLRRGEGLALPGDLRLFVGRIAGSDSAVATPDAKRRLSVLTGAIAVDMESHGVAAAAQAAGVPFLVLRAVADPAERPVPPLAMAGLGADGRLRPWPVLAALARRPGTVPALLRLAGDTRRGLFALRRVAALVPPPFALD